MKLPSKQRGMGWFGMLLVIIMIGFIAMVGLKCWPLLLNEMKIARAVKAVAHDPAIAGSEGAESARKALQKYWDLEDIAFIKSSEVKITNVAQKGRVLAYDYWAQVNVFANVYVSFNFTKEEPFPKAGY